MHESLCFKEHCISEATQSKGDDTGQGDLEVVGSKHREGERESWITLKMTSILAGPKQEFQNSIEICHVDGSDPMITR